MNGKWSPGASGTISRGVAQRYAPTILVHEGLIAVWYLVVKFMAVPSFILPNPVATLATLAGSNYNWISNTLVTASEIFGGYLLAVMVGVAVAIAFSWSRMVEAVAMPLLVSLNMIPKVALGPLLIV